MSTTEATLLADWIEGYQFAMACFPKLHVIVPEDRMEHARSVFSAVPWCALREARASRIRVGSSSSPARCCADDDYPRRARNSSNANALTPTLNTGAIRHGLLLLCWGQTTDPGNIAGYHLRAF